MDSVLKEQALQQTGCTSQECAVQVGKMLGVRKLITGRITKVDENLWLLSAQLVDVETAETQKAESVEHEGTFRQMLTAGAATLAVKMSEGAGAKPAPRVAAQPPPPAPPPPAPAVPKTAPPPPPAVPKAAPPPAPPQQAAQQPEVEAKKGGSSWLWWVVGGAVVLGLVAASSKEDKKKDTSCTTCGTVNVAW
jgi:type IV secretory pathway VirB10-like protein